MTKPSSSLSPFHLAIAVRDLSEARAFYGKVLACAEGRSSDRWVDFDFYGHQLVCHLAAPQGAVVPGAQHSTPVDGHDVPVPHFGVVLQMEEWERLADTLRANGIRFVIEPHIRFQGQRGEQATMFLHDPSGNALEFKAFRDVKAQLFEK